MKIPSSSFFPAQHYVVSPFSFVALIFLGLMVVAAKLRWLLLAGIPLLVVVRFGWPRGMMVSLFLFVAFGPLMNLAAMGVHHFAPPFWDGPLNHSSLRRLRALRFIFSNVIFLSAVVVLASTRIAYLLFRPEVSFGRALKALFFVCGVQVLLLIAARGFEGFRTKNRILLCRRFQEDVSRISRAGLLPALSALGHVATITDESIQSDSTVPEDPQGGPSFPQFDVDLVPVESKDPTTWKPKVSKEMSIADLIVIDLTNFSDSIAWELSESFRLKGPQGVLLVGTIQFLGTEGRKLKELLRPRLRSMCGNFSADQILESVALPLPYSNDLSNLIFAWRICCWHPEKQPVAQDPRILGE
jgi:hypothetical protein